MDELGQRAGGRGVRGEIAGRREVSLAAAATLLGHDGWALLTAEDPFEAQVRQAVIEKAAELHEVDQQRLAVAIVNTLAKSFKG